MVKSITLILVPKDQPQEPDWDLSLLQVLDKCSRKVISLEADV